MPIAAGAWMVAVLLGAAAAHRRSRQNAGPLLPFTVRRFDLHTGTVVVTRTDSVLVLAAVISTGPGTWLGRGRLAGGCGGLLSMLVVWVSDVLGTVLHNHRSTSSVDGELRQL